MQIQNAINGTKDTENDYEGTFLKNDIALSKIQGKYKTAKVAYSPNNL